MFMAVLAMALSPAAPITTARPVAPLSSTKQKHRDARLKQAQWLVDYFHPEEAMVASNMGLWAIRVRRSAQADRALAKIENEYGGAIEAYIAGARPIAAQNARAFVREAKSRKSTVLADRLSVADLARLIGFFRSPVGVKLMRLQQQPGEIERAIRHSRGGDIPVIDETVAARAREEEKRRAVKGLDADELVQVLKFQSDPVALRYADAIKFADEVLLDLIRNPEQERLAREHEAGTRALDAHIAGIKRARR